MKTKGITDLYLPSRVAYHVKIILASLLIAVLFVFIKEGRLWSESSTHLLVLLFIQFELFIWLGKRFFTTKKQYSPQELVKYAILRLLLFYVMAFAISALIFLGYMFIIYTLNGWSLDELIPNILSREIKGFIIGASSGYILGAIIFFYYQWVDALKREQTLKEEKLVFQYETLKSQLNPHFLFNSLNTLSSLVYKSPELSEEFISKLSSIYRYILENSKVEFVSLKEELKFVDDYFYLQQIRDNGKINLQVNVPDPGKFRILPISLQLLMENAIKHNAATRENPLKMKIELHDDTVTFRNNIQTKTQIEQSHKIGLKNLAERVKLTLNKEVEISSSGNEFTVKVPLKPA